MSYSKTGDSLIKTILPTIMLVGSFAVFVALAYKKKEKENKMK